MKKTAKSHSNIALVKYWGKKDAGLRLPRNSSVAIALDEAYTLTTVEFDEKYTQDEVELIGEGFEDDEKEKVSKHLDRVRVLAGITTKAKVISQNNFPKSAGMASSASGFGALSAAAVAASGLNLSERELSVLARNGSGSASRSIPGSVSVWYTADKNEDSYAERIDYPKDWKIKVLLVMAEDTSAKKVSTTEAMANVMTSPYYEIAVKEAEQNIERLKQAMHEGDWSAFGKVIENECYRLHAICMTQQPNILYWRGITIEVFQTLYRLREEGIEAFFTVDAGPHVHIIVREQDVKVVKDELAKLTGIKKVIECGIGPATQIVEEHLF
jgi:diphosphomevalonate decarboxylase